jgi:photosystem II stability/assembly factor-like uncharacterized protein
MRIPKLLFAVIGMLCFFSFQACKKGSDAAPAAPTVKPDTLSAGWSKQVIAGETSSLSDIFFNSATSGYASSNSNLYRSTDGGTNWVKLSLATQNWVNCFVTADNKAFFVAYSSNNIFKTLDGGSNFVNTAITANPVDVFFTDNNNGFCISNNGLFNTMDAGLTWQKVTTTGLPTSIGNYASLSFVNNTTGWIVSQNGINRSVGSLTNWQASVINGGTSGSAPGSVYAVSASIVYAANHNGEIFKSTDAGANFSFIKKLEDGGFTDIHFLTDQIGYASAGRSIYKTTDGGTNWSKVVSMGETVITEIHFTDAAHGWACGSNGVVLLFR